MTSTRRWLLAVGLVGGAVYWFVFGRILRVVRRDSWPPPRSAITPDGVKEAVERFRSAPSHPGDVGLAYAWATASTIEPWAEGEEFYPRIGRDIVAARSSIHILMFGWKPGRVGDELTQKLEQKLEDGVEVRILVDSFGSRPYGLSKAMYGRLAGAGAQIVVNNFLPPRHRGLYPGSRTTWARSLPGRADHRKLYVIDGAVAWTGGAGIEDHFLDGRFHDVMVRVTGDVVGQAQAVFLTSFASHGAPLPPDLTHYFPAAAEAGSRPAAVVQVVPGGFISATQSAFALIDGAQRRLDIMNPYLTDGDAITRIVAAARRGVRVRLVVSQRSNNPLASAALRHRYRELEAAGVEVWEYPDAVVHAKVIVADDRMQFGTLNLDAWALYRNFEIAIEADDAGAADRLRERVFEPDIARCRPAQGATGVGPRGFGWVADKATYFL